MSRILLSLLTHVYSHFVCSFLLSILWIAAFSVLMVWFATVLGDILGISTDVMGW